MKKILPAIIMFLFFTALCFFFEQMAIKEMIKADQNHAIDSLRTYEYNNKLSDESR